MDIELDYLGPIEFVPTNHIPGKIKRLSKGVLFLSFGVGTDFYASEITYHDEWKRIKKKRVCEKIYKFDIDAYKDRMSKEVVPKLIKFLGKHNVTKIEFGSVTEPHVYSSAHVVASMIKKTSENFEIKGKHFLNEFEFYCDLYLRPYSYRKNSIKILEDRNLATLDYSEFTK